MTGRERLIFALILLLTLPLLACGGGGDCPDGFTCKEMTATDYGEQWPLTVEKGVLGCKPVDIVIFKADDGTTYAVNSVAGMTDLYADIRPILANVTGDPGFLRTEGLGLCQGG